MSHFTKCTTKINDLETLLAAARSLGYKVTVGENVPVYGYMHEKITALAAVNLGKYDIGVVRGMDGNFELAADWWGVETTTGRTEAEIVDQISHAYSLRRVLAACEENGYTIETQEENGEVFLTATMWS